MRGRPRQGHDRPARWSGSRSRWQPTLRRRHCDPGHGIRGPIDLAEARGPARFSEAAAHCPAFPRDTAPRSVQSLLSPRKVGYPVSRFVRPFRAGPGAAWRHHSPASRRCVITWPARLRLPVLARPAAHRQLPRCGHRDQKRSDALGRQHAELLHGRESWNTSKRLASSGDSPTACCLP